ncbi:hypothetical protein B0H13DRAFT_1934863 [Mycena leptocephala]|nr:hypothetical protein B0H13DRAFT_1934863 [Mycena leptocephala]
MVEIRDAEPHTLNSRRHCQSQFKNNKHSSSEAVPGDEACCLPPFPSDYTVVYIMTERQANDELRQIQNGAVGIDTEFTERRPTKEEYTILKSIPAGTNKKLALLGWQIGTSYALTPPYPDSIVVWVLDMWKIRCIPKELRCILLDVLGFTIDRDLQSDWSASELGLFTAILDRIRFSLDAKLSTHPIPEITGVHNRSYGEATSRSSSPFQFLISKSHVFFTLQAIVFAIGFNIFKYKEDRNFLSVRKASIKWKGACPM